MVIYMTKHGMYKMPIYRVWLNMIQRCKNPNDKDYKNYGGRGIKVCKRWHSFENFYADVGDPPAGMFIDRWPDNDGDYELGNWRCATSSQQKFNSRPASCGPLKQRWFFAFNLNTGEWDEDNSQKAFAHKRNLNQGHISGCLCNRLKTHKGWIFQPILNQKEEINAAS